MILDMNSDGQMNAEAQAYPDWPVTPPPKRPVREEVSLTGSRTAGRTLSVTGTADAPAAANG